MKYYFIVPDKNLQLVKKLLKTTEQLIESLGMETELKEKRILDTRPKS